MHVHEYYSDYYYVIPTLHHFMSFFIFHLSTSNLQKFSSQKIHMQLNSSCLRNLEIFQNISDGGSRGTLFSVIDRTKTRFGSRLLKQWLSMPLLSVRYFIFFINSLLSHINDLFVPTFYQISLIFEIFIFLVTY